MFKMHIRLPYSFLERKAENDFITQVRLLFGYILFRK